MNSASSSAWVTINRIELLRFFDEKPYWSEKHATGIVGIVGEDLNAASFRHYLESSGAKVCIRSDSVTTGHRKGPRLDRWIVVDSPDEPRTIFQTEIKNGSAHAFGGKSLSISAPPEKIAKYKQSRWERHWDMERHTLKDASTAKVLVRMKPPDGYDADSIRPLLIFWEAIGPRDKADDHLFSMKDPSHDFPFEPPSTWPCIPVEDKFPDLWVFSVSSYLRSLTNEGIELKMPIAAHRIRTLDRLFSTASE